MEKQKKGKLLAQDVWKALAYPPDLFCPTFRAVIFLIFYLLVDKTATSN